MSDAPFDAYYLWLGIPPQEQPPDLYRLLGLALYESNPNVIEAAADRQMNHVRGQSLGPHAALSQQLLNELAQAKLCLLQAQRKAAYDEQLSLGRHAPSAAPGAAASPFQQTGPGPAPSPAYPAAYAQPGIAYPQQQPVYSPQPPVYAVQQPVYAAPPAFAAQPVAYAADGTPLYAGGVYPQVYQAAGAPVADPADYASDQEYEPPPEDPGDITADRPNTAARRSRRRLSPLKGMPLWMKIAGHALFAVIGLGIGLAILSAIGRNPFRSSPQPAPEAPSVAPAKGRTSLPGERTDVASSDGSAAGRSVASGTTNRTGGPADGGPAGTGKRQQGDKRPADDNDPPDPRPPAAELLTKPIFPLEALDLDSVFHAGSWRREEQGLSVQSEGSPAVLQIPAPELPYDFQLRMRVQRTAAQEQTGESNDKGHAGYFGVGFQCANGKRAQLLIDGASGSRRYSGIQYLDGKPADRNVSTRLSSPLISANQPSEIVVCVRERELKASVDGKVVLEWNDDPGRLSQGDSFPGFPAGRMHLVADGAFRVESLELLPLTSLDLAFPAAVAYTRGPGGAMREPRPDDATLKELRKEIKESLPKEIRNPRSSEQKIAQAKKLLELAGANTGNSARRFAMLDMATELAGETAQFGLAGQAITALEASYEVDTLALKARSLREAVKIARSPENFQLIAGLWAELLLQAMSQHRYEQAAQYAQSAAEYSKQSGQKLLSRRLVTVKLEIAQLKAAFSAGGASHRDRPLDDHNRPSSAAWGRFLCCYRNDWFRGRQILALGDDADAELARRDLSVGQDPAERVALADAWWERAEREEDLLPRRNLRSHATELYGQVVSNLSADERSRVQARIDEIDQKYSLWEKDDWVDILPTIDVGRNIVVGSWERSGTEISIIGPAPTARAFMPIIPSGSYDLEVKFIVREGTDVQLICPMGPRHFQFALGGYGGTVGGIQFIDGKPVGQNSASVSPSRVDNGKTHTLTLRVELTSANAAIQVDLNGKKYVEWAGPATAITLDPNWSLPTPGVIGIGSSSSKVAFSSARIRYHTGGLRFFGD